MMVASNLLGNSLGFLLPSFLVNDTQPDGVVRFYFQQVLLMKAALALLPVFLSCLYWKEAPPSPASIEPSAEHISYLLCLKQLILDRRFLLLLWVFGSTGSVFACYASLFGSILDPFGYSSSQISCHGIELTLCGIVGALGAGYLIQRLGNYQTVFRLLAVLTMVVSVGFYAFLQEVGYHFPLSLVFVGLFGVLLLAFVPIVLNYACDALYPHN